MKLEVGGGDGGAACRSIFAFRFLIACAVCVYVFFSCSVLFFRLSQIYLHRRYALNALCICCFVVGVAVVFCFWFVCLSFLF